MFTKSIAREAKRIMNSRIKHAQKELDANCREIDKNTEHIIQSAKAEAEVSKNEVFKKLIKSVLGDQIV